MLTDAALSNLSSMLGESTETPTSFLDENGEIAFNVSAALSLAGPDLATAFADEPDLTEEQMLGYVMECLPRVLAEAHPGDRELQEWAALPRLPSMSEAKDDHAITKAANKLTKGATDAASHAEAFKAHTAAAAAFTKAGDSATAQHHQISADYHAAHGTLAQKAGRGLSSLAKKAAGGIAKHAWAVAKGAGKGIAAGASKVASAAAPKVAAAKQAAVSKFVSAGHAAMAKAKHVGAVVKAAAQAAHATHQAAKAAQATHAAAHQAAHSGNWSMAASALRAGASMPGHGSTSNGTSPKPAASSTASMRSPAPATKPDVPKPAAKPAASPGPTQHTQSGHAMMPAPHRDSGAKTKTATQRMGTPPPRPKAPRSYGEGVVPFTEIDEFLAGLDFEAA